MYEILKIRFFMPPVSMYAITVWLETPEQVKSQTFNEKNAQWYKLCAFYISPYW